ncbi:unnamed protein product [Calicophoron daubneyi]|uniref:Uncharacterized protein n=1 Tax=Calicophoron daubneyi TaxID=300641 RepID=A0AAV2TRS6_CALDB
MLAVHVHRFISGCPDTRVGRLRLCSQRGGCHRRAGGQGSCAPRTQTPYAVYAGVQQDVVITIGLVGAVLLMSTIVLLVAWVSKSRRRQAQRVLMKQDKQRWLVQQQYANTIQRSAVPGYRPPFPSGSLEGMQSGAFGGSLGQLTPHVLRASKEVLTHEPQQSFRRGSNLVTGSRYRTTESVGDLSSRSQRIKRKSLEASLPPSRTFNLSASTSLLGYTKSDAYSHLGTEMVTKPSEQKRERRTRIRPPRGSNVSTGCLKEIGFDNTKRIHGGESRGYCLPPILYPENEMLSSEEESDGEDTGREEDEKDLDRWNSYAKEPGGQDDIVSPQYTEPHFGDSDGHNSIIRGDVRERTQRCTQRTGPSASASQQEFASTEGNGDFWDDTGSGFVYSKRKQHHRSSRGLALRKAIERQPHSSEV